MKKKQSVLTLIGRDGKFFAPNRKTARFLEMKETEFTRITQIPKTNEKKAEFHLFRKELAKTHGSKTGKLKKKHFNRERKLNETNV